jgi:hypothetical protein
MARRDHQESALSRNLPLLLTFGGLAGLAFLGYRSISRARALLQQGPTPVPQPIPSASPGDQAQLGDVVQVAPNWTAGLYNAAPGAVGVLLTVTAPGPTDLTGTITGVVLPDGPHAVIPAVSLTVPRSAVVALTRAGTPIAQSGVPPNIGSLM